MNPIASARTVLIVTLDTLRYDTAKKLHQEGRTRNLNAWLGASGWEKRHSPATFTFPAHQSLFAGFGPTPLGPGPHPRSLALAFPGSNTITKETLTFESPNIIAGFAELGFHTICIGGVGFFNPTSPLGKVLPDLFQEAHWSPKLGVTDPDSPRHQIDLAIHRLQSSPGQTLLFINISALHQPNYFYLPGAKEDSLESHEAALERWTATSGNSFTFSVPEAPATP
jgi:hypothetical protein